MFFDALLWLQLILDLTLIILTIWKILYKLGTIVIWPLYGLEQDIRRIRYLA